MTLESKVTSLSLSRKLDAAFKKKGIKPPESEFSWMISEKFKAKELKPKTFHPNKFGIEWDQYPAYLSDELLEEMPAYLETKGSKLLTIQREVVSDRWIVTYSGQNAQAVDESLSEASGEMTLWLIDNGYYE